MPTLPGILAHWWTAERVAARLWEGVEKSRASSPRGVQGTVRTDRASVPLILLDTEYLVRYNVRLGCWSGKAERTEP